MSNLEYYLNLVKQIDFPLYEKDLQKAQKSLERLTEAKANPKSNIGLDVIHQYYPSIFDCNIKNRPTPKEAWYDYELMTKVIKNRLKYKGDALSPEMLRLGLSVTKLAPKVSIFRPMLAKYLIEKYLFDCSTIFDPCAGFGGRLLGAYACNKQYFGQEINSRTVQETNELIKELSLKNVNVELKNSLYATGEYECLFTCPPYGDKESWHQEIEILSSDEWITECLQNYKCKKYLFIVDKTEKYTDYIVETFFNKSHFSNAAEQIIYIEIDCFGSLLFFLF